MEINQLQPQRLFNYFEQILKIPRPSKKEQKIIDFLVQFAQKNNLQYKVDDVGNVLILKAATKGKENKKTVILQSHLDMVPEKATISQHNFEKDPIIAFVDTDGWVKSKETTLGADDGIGIAAAMAVLTANNIEHPAIEALFTVDEESGMTGAFGIDPNLLNGKILINLDSEDEGELFIGSAGGMDTSAVFEFFNENSDKNHIAIEISIDKLHGGHSGDEIHFGYGNAIKFLNRIIYNLNKLIDLRLARFEGGSLRNAIPKDAKAIITFESNNFENFKKLFEQYKNEIFQEYSVIEPDMIIEYMQIETPKHLIDRQTHQLLLWSIYSAPHGVYAWDKEIEGLVQTSTNLATIKMNGNSITIGTSQRSSIDSQKFDIANKVRTTFELAGAKVTHGKPYPGWKPNTKSEILDITVNSYKKLFNEQPKVRAIHAGLECGLFLEKYPHLDIISFGPTIKGAHTPFEKLDIKSTQKFWDLLVDVLKTI